MNNLNEYNIPGLDPEDGDKKGNEKREGNDDKGNHIYRFLNRIRGWKCKKCILWKLSD